MTAVDLDLAPAPQSGLRWLDRMFFGGLAGVFVANAIVALR